MKHRKFKPYIRRLSSKDKTESMVMAYRIAYYNVMNKPAFVLVQHGFRNQVIEIDDTKERLKNRLLLGGPFKHWQKRIKKFGQLI